MSVMLQAGALQNGPNLVKLRKKGQIVIPERPAGRKQMLRELSGTVAEIRLEAKGKGLDKMSQREINAAVAAARRALKKNQQTTRQMIRVVLGCVKR